MGMLLEEQETRDPAILLIRRSWQNGLTLSQTWKRMQARMPACAVQTVITEWRKIRRLVGCKSLPLSYVNGWRERDSRPLPPTERELSAVVGRLSAGVTYGDWKGITGPGKRFLEILQATEERYGNKAECNIGGEASEGCKGV